MKNGRTRAAGFCSQKNCSGKISKINEDYEITLSLIEGKEDFAKWFKCKPLFL